MPRRIDSNGQPEPLDPEVIEKFLKVGIPYRLAMLRLAEDVSPAQSTIDSAFIEAAIVSGRLLMQFLGLGIERRGGLKLVQRHDYHMADGHTDEVKIPDLGGRFVDITSLHRATKETLAQFHNGASKASAHLTWDSGHQLSLENLLRGISVIRTLVSTHLPQRETEGKKGEKAGSPQF
jgi:hypothetical protein